MQERELKFDLDDVVIVPSESSEINSRNECDPYTNLNGIKTLPIIAAPMDTVVSSENYNKYIQNEIIPCIPRGNAEKHLLGTYMYFQSFGLCEIEKQLGHYKLLLGAAIDGIVYMSPETCDHFYNYPNVLIDIANGHMLKLIDIIKDIKKYWPDLQLMVGNIANPETYVNLGLAGVDFCRIAIGVGAGCFIKGTKIKTSEGDKNIENINTDDLVYTHKGNLKNVDGIISYKTADELIKINDKIICTKDHKFYAVKKEYFDKIIDEKTLHMYAEWVEAQNLNDNYYIIEMV